MSTAALPGPVRQFAAQLDELVSSDLPDMDQVGQLLVELAVDAEFFAPLIAQIHPATPGDRWLIRPERGPRLVLVHRPEGVMGYTHSHRCWVGIAPVRGVETHQSRPHRGWSPSRLCSLLTMVPGQPACHYPGLRIGGPVAARKHKG